MATLAGTRISGDERDTEGAMLARPPDSARPSPKDGLRLA